VSAGPRVSGPNEPKILIRDRRTEGERGGGQRAKEGPAGMSMATGYAVFILHAPMVHMVWLRPEWNWTQAAPHTPAITNTISPDGRTEREDKERMREGERKVGGCLK